MQEQTTHIPKFSYPFKKIINSKECFKSLAGKDEGNYLFTSQGFWHGGLHFNNSFGEEIRAIADGEIVAYRINDKYLEDEKGIYSTGFFLIKHYFEYPLNNKLTFFSLYMHTAKKEDYCIKITGSKRHLRSGYENSLNSEAIGEELNLDTNIIIDGKWKKNRAKVLFIENQTIDLTQELTIHKSNVTKENNIEYFKDIAKILNRNIVNQVDILEKPIEIKAGEIIGLMGEYNVSKNTNTKSLHLEVFTKDDIKSFSEKAKEYCEKSAVKKEKKLPPISFDWAKIIEIKSNDKISILEKLENLIIPKLQKNGAKLNSSYEELFKLIDNDNNKELDQQEIKDATKNEMIKITTSNYIVKHSSEWDITTNMADVLLEISSKYKNELDEDDIIREKERIKKLSFFNECKSIADFPQSDEVFHLNAIGLVNEFIAGCELTAEKLHTADPLATLINCEKYIKGFNLAFEKFEMDTCLKKAHFLAQILHESGHLRLTKEGGGEDYLQSQRYYPYVGRGLIQITWENNYKNYGLAVGEDFLSATNMIKLETAPHASQSAGWFWKNGVKLRNGISIDLNLKADRNDFLKITTLVNGAFNGFDDRLKILKALFQEFGLTESTEYKFNESEIYEDPKLSFAWGLWHDPLVQPYQGNIVGCSKDVEKAKEGYRRVTELLTLSSTEKNQYSIQKHSELASYKDIHRDIYTYKFAKRRLDEL